MFLTPARRRQHLIAKHRQSASPISALGYVEEMFVTDSRSGYPRDYFFAITNHGVSSPSTRLNHLYKGAEEKKA